MTVSPCPNGSSSEWNSASLREAIKMLNIHYRCVSLVILMLCAGSVVAAWAVPDPLMLAMPWLGLLALALLRCWVLARGSSWRMRLYLNEWKRLRSLPEEEEGATSRMSRLRQVTLDYRPNSDLVSVVRPNAISG